MISLFRHILLDNDHTDMAIGCEILLYMASRTQLMERIKLGHEPRRLPVTPLPDDQTAANPHRQAHARSLLAILWEPGCRVDPGFQWVGKRALRRA